MFNFLMKQDFLSVRWRMRIPLGIPSLIPIMMKLIGARCLRSVARYDSFQCKLFSGRFQFDYFELTK